MAVEIERKYLVKKTDCLKNQEGVRIVQGYMPMAKGVLRIRLAGTTAYLTIKGGGLISRPEFEYEIPVPDAKELLALFCNDRRVSKTRYSLPYENHLITVDVFHEENDGLVLAEIELGDEAEEIILPDWLGEEVSQDSRYHNSNLIHHPFSCW